MVCRGIAWAMAASMLAGCAARAPIAPAPTPVTVTPDPAWAGLASADEQALLAALPARFVRARATVPRRLLAQLRAEGTLLDPAVAEPLPQLPPGPYLCRLVRFGGKQQFRAFAPDFCYVDAAEASLSFTKQTGSNLPEGYIYPDSDTRQVFLGTFRTAGDPAARGYGKDPARDIGGIVERVAPFRWRLILTRAGQGATLDLYELVPVTPSVPGAPGTTPAG